jgi:hypothetical protein
MDFFFFFGIFLLLFRLVDPAGSPKPPDSIAARAAPASAGGELMAVGSQE